MTKKNNVYEMTKIATDFYKTENKATPHFESKYPHFANYCMENHNHEIWEYMHAVSKFYIQRYAQLADSNRVGSAKFWHRNNASRLMFYRLLDQACLMIKRGSNAIGLPQKELNKFLVETCDVADRTIHDLIKEAVDAGYADKTKWWRDDRVSVVYLSPLSLAEYADVGIYKHYISADASGIALANLRFEQALEKSDGQFSFDFMGKC